jgi:signal transduction histidine kinase
MLVSGTGLNLAIRLYLLLVAIFVPTFCLYFFYTMRMIDALHAREVEDTMRACRSRVEDWILGHPNAMSMEPGEREALGRELKRIADEAHGVERVAVYAGGEEDGLRFLAGHGFGPASTPTAHDREAMVSGSPRQLTLLRGEREFLAVSIPFRQEGSVRGIVHMEILPAKIGLGPRIPEVRRGLLIGAVGIMLVVGLGVVIFFHATVGRPTRSLVDAMRRASEGDLNANVDIRTGEFGFLGRSYNQMIQRLKGSIEENARLLSQVRAFKEDLEEKIAVANRELASKNEQLQNANEKLFHLQRQMATLEKLATLGQIAALIAHELGSPLNAISGHIQLLLEDQVSDPRLLGRLKAIDAQVDRLTGIVRNVLKAMRVPPPRFDRIRVDTVIGDVADLIRPMAQKRGVLIERQSDPHPPSITADADQLQQVFLNLLSNALDAIHDQGTVRISTSFIPASEAARMAIHDGPALSEANYIRIDVADTGEGMDEETARQAFEPFYTTKTDQPGGGSAAGLGLSICRQIVKNHAGEIAVHSQRGLGTTFTLFLPIEPNKMTA